MSPLTCPEVEEQIDLYAAGECDAPARSEVERHLADCPSCARRCDEARRLIVLLDLHGRQAEGLRRLQARIAEETRPRRALRSLTLPARRVLAFHQPLRALAALFLLTLGLTWWLPSGAGPGLSADLAAPADFAPQEGRAEVIKHPADARFTKALASRTARAAPTFTLDLAGQTPAAFRERLHTAAGTADLPRPPEVNLALELHNRGDRVLRIWLDRRATLTLELLGPGAVTVPARDAAVKLFEPGRVLTLAPGQTGRLPIPRLAYGRADDVWYAYWTKPGVYTLTIRLHTWVCRGETGTASCGFQTITGPPTTIRVRPPAP
jgi:hypothetical protein